METEFDKKNISSDQNLVEGLVNRIGKISQETKLTAAQRLRQYIRWTRQNLEGSRANGIDPLELFPEEIWINILEGITATHDLIACKAACSLFNRNVKATDVELLLGMTMPMVSEFLEKPDILSCRLVCRNWKNGIDNCVENYFAIKPRCSHSGEKLTVNLPKYLGDLEETWEKFNVKVKIPHHRQRQKEYSQVKSSQLARSLSVKFINCQNVDKVKIFQNCEAQVFKARNHVRYLSIEHEDKEEKFTASDFFELCQSSLSQCTELKKLSLVRWEFIGFETNQNETDDPIPLEEATNRSIMFHHAPNLKTLFIQVNCEKSMQELDTLLQIYSRQLKDLFVKNWNYNYNHTLSWDVLTSLTIADECCDQTLESLQRLNAPKLTVLDLCLTKSAAASIEQLLKTVHHFGSLQVLRLDFEETFPPWTNKEICSIPTDICMHANLRTLDIALFSKFNSNILLCFPFLKTLSLRCLHQGGLQHVPDGHEFVRIAQYIPTENDKTRFYKSNIWEILPQLQDVSIEYDFTREGYNWFLKDPKEKSNQIMKIIKSNARYVSRIHACNSLAKFQEQIAKNLGNISEAIINSAKTLEEVFQVMLPNLDKSCILRCRETCKDWECAVDISLSKQALSDFIYKFSLPQDQNKTKLPEWLKAHKRNPIVGKSVEVELHQPPEMKREELIADFIALFEEIGKYIAHLKFSNEEETILPVATFYHILVRMSEYCQNLESLDIRNLKLTWAEEETWNGPLDKALCNNRLFFRRMPKFQVYLSNQQDSGMEPIHTNFLNKYRKQFHVLELGYWGDWDQSYCHKMPVLQQLLINTTEADEDWFYDLKESLSAPLLTKLGIREDCEKSWPIDSTIGYLNRCYPKLKGLEIYFANTCPGFLVGDIHDIDPYLVSHIENLTLVLKNKYQISFDFLVHFPLLRKLTILHGEWIENWYKLELKRKDEKRFTNLKTDEKGRGDRETDFIPLAKHFWEENEHSNESSFCVFESNIWIVLPRLRALEVGKGTSEFGKNVVKSYTREAYEYANQ